MSTQGLYIRRTTYANIEHAAFASLICRLSTFGVTSAGVLEHPPEPKTAGMQVPVKLRPLQRITFLDLSCRLWTSVSMCFMHITGMSTYFDRGRQSGYHNGDDAGEDEGEHLQHDRVFLTDSLK